MMTDRDCPFCQRVAAGDYDLGRNRQVVGFFPLNPVVLGHYLWLPREHVMNAAVSPETTGKVFAEASEYGHRQGVPFNLITSVGTAATQTVFHLHVHYVPRRPGDDLHLPWSINRTENT